MDFLKEWITNIILFVLLATVIDMLLPNSSFQKYTKMVTGLLLIAIILTPVMKLLSNDFETALASIPALNSEEKNMENLIEMKKKEIQASSHAYILQTMAVQLKTDVEEELMDQFGLEIAHIDLVVDENGQLTSPDDLQKIVVVVKKAEEAEQVVEVVKKVEINTEKPLPSKQEAKSSERIASLLSEIWSIEKDAVEVMVEGGKLEENG